MSIEATTPQLAPYPACMAPDGAEPCPQYAQLDAENAGLRGEAQRLRSAYGLLEIVAATLAVHVLGHFAMSSETSPAICQQWAEAVQKTIADNAVK